jgi:PAS domain S-box-containing protein
MTESTLYRNILEHMREGVMSVALDGTVITFNAAAEQILEFPGTRILGKPFAPVLLELEGSDDFVQAVLDAVYDSAVIHQERVAFTTAAGIKTLAMTTSFLYDSRPAAGEPAKIGVIAVFGDITEVEKLRETVRAMEALKVEQMVRAYRERGHVLATLDPLGFAQPCAHEELDPVFYGLNDADLDKTFTVLRGNTPVTWPLRRILEAFRQVYCGAVGVQYMHIDDLAIQGWLRDRLESPEQQRPLARETQFKILRKLTDAEVWKARKR